MKPPALKPGDTIAVVSPASPMTAEKLVPMTELLEQEGYRVRVFPHALDRDGYLAGTDVNRAKDLQDAFEDASTDAILCSRGGYGSARLLPHLNFNAISQNPKLFVGFSDITTLHLALNHHGMPTLYAPMAFTLAYPREKWVFESFLNALKGDLTIPSDAPRGVTVKGGIATGIATGGCLCLIGDSIGTDIALDPKGKILFIEDVDEAPHRVDAMFTYLRNSGILSQVSGVVIGEMTRTDEKADKDIGYADWRSIVRERVSDLNVPIIIDFPFGHAKNMLTLGLGVQVEMNADQGTVRYLEAVCR